MTYDPLYGQQKKYPLTHTRQVTAALEIISEDITRHISIKDLANKAGTNECTLKKWFKEILNTTVYQYLLTRRMRQAYLLLTTTTRKEKDIAMECGFETLSGFITTFHRYYGKSPGQLRIDFTEES